MALVKLTFADPAAIPISKKMGAPKKMTMEAWFKSARKIIPEIPDPTKTDWIITAESATNDARFITYELANTVGERCHIVIDRTIPLIG